MEYIKDPVNNLKYFHSLLNENGDLFITVPNIHATSKRLKFFLVKIILRKKHYDSDHIF